MTEGAGQDLRAASGSVYERLPERVDPADLVLIVETEAPPDPVLGRDPDTEFMLRYC